jgi:hypothetical protein
MPRISTAVCMPLPALGDFTERVRRAISNFVTAVVDNDGDVERLKPEEVNRLLILVDKVVNMNKSPEYLADSMTRAST